MKEPKFYLVWREGTTPKHKHSTYESAKKECERLTRTHGGMFHVLSHAATAKQVDVVFEEVNELDVPF